MTDKLTNMNVWDFLPEFTKALEEQLIEDNHRWGDTWLQRPREGQDDRLVETLRNYCDQYKNAQVPLPYLKIAGNALINWIRDKHPGYWER